MLTNLALFDLSAGSCADPAAQQTLAAEIAANCQQQGIFLIKNHGVAADLIMRLRGVSEQFFALPEQEKLSYRRTGLGQNRGYFTLEESTIQASEDNTSQPELRRLFSSGPPDVPEDDYYHCDAAYPHFASNLWPLKPAGFEPVWRQYYQAMEQLSTTLMGLFAIAFGVSQQHFAADFDRHTSLLRVADYPPQYSAAKQNQWRCSAHCDLSVFTIIQVDDAPGGLQVHHADSEANNNGDGRWLDVPYIPGTLVVLLGELMKIYTNSLWPAPLHRVANPPATAGVAGQRQSIQFFYQPNYDAVMHCLDNCCSQSRPAQFPPLTLSDITALYQLKNFTPV